MNNNKYSAIWMLGKVRYFDNVFGFDGYIGEVRALGGKVHFLNSNTVVICGV